MLHSGGCERLVALLSHVNQSSDDQITKLQTVLVGCILNIANDYTQVQEKVLNYII